MTPETPPNTLFPQDPRRTALIAMGLLAVALLMAAPVIHYSTWSIDEQEIAGRALGFLDYDFNPRWFGYHTLPLYLLSAVYFVIYLVYSLTGLAASKLEFVGLLFANDAVFYISARIVFSFAYTLGCYVLGRIILRHYGSITAAVLFFCMALFLQDAVTAANVIRVDTFVFLFLCLTVWFSCYAPKTTANFVFSVAACAAAFASKFSAIVLFPVLLLRLVYDIYKGWYPPATAVYFLLLAPAFVVLFMPYMVLDFDSYRPVLQRIIAQSSGGVVHAGKVYHAQSLDRLLAPWNLVNRQVGIVTLMGGVAAAIWSVFRDRNLLFVVLFTGACIVEYATTPFVDKYWLRPAYPLFLFLAVVFLIQSGRWLSPTKYAAVGSAAAQRQRRGTVTGILLLLFAGYYAIFQHQGLGKYYNSITTTSEDTRITAGRWIREHLPEYSMVILDSGLPHYVPKVFYPNEGLLLETFNYAGAKRNPLLRSAFHDYYQRQLAVSKKFNGGVLDITRPELLPPQGIRFPAGAYIVISSHTYRRFYTKQMQQQFPQMAAQGRAHYDFIQRQQLIREFSGRGPDIRIYRLRKELVIEKPAPQSG